MCVSLLVSWFCRVLSKSTGGSYKMLDSTYINSCFFFAHNTTSIDMRACVVLLPNSEETRRATSVAIQMSLFPCVRLLPEQRQLYKNICTGTVDVCVCVCCYYVHIGKGRGVLKTNSARMSSLLKCVLVPQVVR